MSAADYKIYQALCSLVNTNKGTLRVAWENTPFDTTINTPYIRPEILRDMVQNQTLGRGSLVEHRGTFLIEIAYPVGSGANSPMNTIVSIRTAFKGGTEIAFDGINVIIEATERLSPLYEKAWTKYPLLVRWRCHATE